MPYSSYHEVLEEQRLLAAATPSVQTRLTTPNVVRPSSATNPIIIPPSHQLPPTTLNGKLLGPQPMRPSFNTVISPLQQSNFDFAKRVQGELDKLDVKVFGQKQMNEYLRNEERDEIEADAIAEIQRNCKHPNRRNGTMRVNGNWYVGDICQDCDKLINPFPDSYREISERERQARSQSDSLQGS